MFFMLFILVLVLDIEIISEYVENRLKVLNQLIVVVFFLAAELVFGVISLIQILRFLLFRTVDQMGDFLIGFPHQLHILKHYSVAIAALDIRSSRVPDYHPRVVGVSRKSRMIFKQETHV